MSTSPDPFNLSYRVEVLEKWRDMVEHEGIAKTLAVMEERQRVQGEMVLMHDEVIKQLVKSSSHSEGGKLTIKNVITYGIVTALLAGGFILQLVTAIGKGP